MFTSSKDFGCSLDFVERKRLIGAVLQCPEPLLVGPNHLQPRFLAGKTLREAVPGCEGR